LRHVPQFAGSVAVSAHCAPGPVQDVVPGSQVHAPALHDPRLQNAWQEPQWDGSFATLTQAPPQSDVPAGHAHWPATHDDPAGQAVAQLPQ
jgi:hypothetical protein